MIAFGKGQKFDLVQCPYGRHGSGLYLYEDYESPSIRMANFKAGSLMSGGDFFFNLQVMQRDKSVRYFYHADEGSLTMTQYGDAHGHVEAVLTYDNHARFRGNCGFRLVLNPQPDNQGAVACKGVFKFLDGSGIEADFGKHGRMFFRAIHGELSVSADFDYTVGYYKSFAIEVQADDETGGFDLAVHENLTGDFNYGSDYKLIDELIAANKADLAEFKKNYAPVAKGYEETAEYAMWLIWSHRVKPEGYYKTPMILMHLQYLNACASWQQSYNAMSMQGNPKEAWRQICSLFEHQDEETGKLPGMLFYSGAGAMQSPFQGFALDFVIRKCGDSFITEAECKKMYPKFAKWIEFWVKFRSAKRGDDVIAINTQHDSGWDDATIFKNGFPVSTPDIIALLIVLMECTARLANGAGYNEDAESWKARADCLLETLINDFWDGEKFAAMKNGEKLVDSMSFVNYQAILLGDRLPTHIIDKIAEKLTSEEEFLSPIGLCTESMKSPLCTWGHSFVRGRVIVAVNMILTVGLHLAGKKKEASMIARRICDKIKQDGMILGFAPPYSHYPLTGNKVELDVPPLVTDPWPWNTWAANSFLTMATSIIED